MWYNTEQLLVLVYVTGRDLVYTKCVCVCVFVCVCVCVCVQMVKNRAYNMCYRVCLWQCSVRAESVLPRGVRPITYTITSNGSVLYHNYITSLIKCIQPDDGHRNIGRNM